MFVESPNGCNILLSTLNRAPDIFSDLIVGLTELEADFRPDVARFTIREVMAHLAEWDAIFLDRLQQTCDKEYPMLEEYDEAQLALNYPYTDPFDQCQLFRARRIHLVDFARAFTLEEWHRPCLHPRIGQISLEGLVAVIPLHDSYHIQQVVSWRRLYEIQQD